MTEADGDPCFIKLDYPQSVISQQIKSSSPKHPVNIEEVQKLAAKGLDSSPYIDRTLSWLLILKLYPPDKTKWPSIFNELKSQYFDYVNYTNLQDWHKKQISPSITIDDFGKELSMGTLLDQEDSFFSCRSDQFCNRRQKPILVIYYLNFRSIFDD